MKPFDLRSCRSKLEDYYQRTATVPTSVWSKKYVVNINQIYTRLSLVKKEQTPAGKNEDKLQHYSDLFTANQNGVIPKRILVQGQTGIGKSTFVKKLLVDWAGVNNVTADEKTAVLKNFEIVVAVNLKEVSKCQSLQDVIRLSNVFATEDKYMAESLVDYITNNQEKVLLIFDGYDEYHCGRDSDIYEIFLGNSLRSCCVLITTRISKADQLLGAEDLHAEITGFSEVDRGDFMHRFLGDNEASKLQALLRERSLEELSKVPLLLLFFCTLWKRGKSEHFPKSKSELYMGIVQFILSHNHSKHSLPQYVEVNSHKQILSEIGKVALRGLLRDDQLFEYSHLFNSVLCDEKVFIGLFQVTEYSETLRPTGLVSFIHKSIQEFLAAWYVAYKCIPDSENLGEIGVKLEECLALENVFQFICGLSDDAAFAVLNHLKSVRISDPSLDLSTAVPDVGCKTEVPLSDITERQRKFSDLVYGSFEEVVSKENLSSTCLDCLGGVLLLSKNLPKELFQNHSWSLVSAIGRPLMDPMSRLYDSLTIMSCIDALLRITESPHILNVGRFFRWALDVNCLLQSVLCYRNGQVEFYIKHLTLTSVRHSSLFTAMAASSHSAESMPVPSHSAESGFTMSHSCLTFLKTLTCATLEDDSMEGLGEVVKSCIRLENIKVSQSNDSLCNLLEQVPNPGGCSLSIRYCDLTPKGAAKLASLLPQFEDVTSLNLCLTNCPAKTLTRLVSAIKQKNLKELELRDINLTFPVAEAIGQVLPELSALKTLEISGSDDVWRDLELDNMDALFGRFNKPSLLEHLTIAYYFACGNLAPLINKLCFFPCLVSLTLVELGINESDFSGLLENMKFIPDMEFLHLAGNSLGNKVRSMVPHLPKLPNLRTIRFGLEDCSEEDLDYIQEAVREKLPKLQLERRRRPWLTYIDIDFFYLY